MSIPPNIRVNTRIGFPALVYGTGPITVLRQNGIFTINFSIAAFGTQVPPIGNYTTDYVLAYDSVSNTFFKMTIAALIAAAAISGASRTQRSVTASPIIIAGSDQILNVNIAAGTPTCALPPYATRAGIPITFVDAGLHFGSFPLIITPNGSETIINAQNPSSFIMNANGQVATLNPFNDGVNAGWFLS